MRFLALAVIMLVFASMGDPLWVSMGSSQAQAAEIEEPAGYRGEPYRAPVPETLAGATVLDNEEAHQLWQSKQAQFIDVLPYTPKPANLPKGTIWREKPHQSIPGAFWLINVGYEKLAEETLNYFKAGLDAASKGDKSGKLVFFCLDDCWMSWNAAKRAISLGYTHVYWYREGMDGWTFEDYPSEKIIPFALANAPAKP